METQSRSFLQVTVEKNVYMVRFVVYQPERGYRTGRDAKILYHPFFGSEGEFTLSEPFFDGMYIHRTITIENHQVMAIPLMIAKKQVFAVLRIVSRPILFGDLDCRRRRMLEIFELDVELFQQRVKTRISVHRLQGMGR